jgi:hypothetical protein
MCRDISAEWSRWIRTLGRDSPGRAHSTDGLPTICNQRVYFLLAPGHLLCKENRWTLRGDLNIFDTDHAALIK